ncbi:hypothetical protein CDL12_08079 [Handroanthus impetiginosus]|uniref:Uncharacterized protein n=1 Tax=Handroanthus impetiginosus TaxID=429701 RepID=A0A2G9HNZ1_9LAMI|nr:hypothetical protein CDL12_08079 [Handroanthus impetiginosus]
MRDAHKEALQELISTDNAITRHFDCHAWVHVPEELGCASISGYTVRQIMEQQKAKEELASTSEAPTEEVLKQKVLEMLMHKRYLIVLDEIQFIEVWQQLEQVFPKISTGSRIILITSEHTCPFLKSSSKAIFDPVKLGGLPSETRGVLNSLPLYLRQCLHYFLLFPAQFEIPTRRIIVLWVAEGLVCQNELESDEDVANRYLNRLMELEMVVAKREKLNGKFKACQLKEHIRETLSTTAKESRFFQDTPKIIYRLVDHHGTIDSCFIQIQGNPKTSTSLKNYRNVLSFMSFNTQEGNKPGEDLGNFLRKCISAGGFLELRVLDLEKVFRPKLPEAICDLMLLKYLGLRWTYLEHLPRYVNKLLNLHVLDVKHTYISVLPRSIWRMQYLRHLYLSETYCTKFVGCPSDVSLDELQTLWGAFIDENTYVRNGLDTARKIRKLGLSCRSTSSQNSLMAEQLKVINRWISNLELLEVLRLKSRDENGKASELLLEPLRNEKLSTVYLLGKLEPSVVYEFPENLLDITLSGSELNIDPMICLEKLPQLRILRLLAQSVVCRSMRCSKGGFPQLKVLKIWKVENLEEWEVEEGALLSLKFLEIRACTNLKMLPNALQHVDTLQECMLTSMPEQFIDQTKDRQPELWAKIKLDPSADQEQI